MKRAAALLIVVAVIAVLGYTERDSIVKSLAMRGIEAAFLAHFHSDHTGEKVVYQSPLYKGLYKD